MGSLSYDDFKERYKIANNLLDATTVVTKEDVQKAFATIMVYNAWREEEEQAASKAFRKAMKEARTRDQEAFTELDSKVEDAPAVNKNNI